MITKKQRIYAQLLARLRSKNFNYNRAIACAKYNFPKYSKVKGVWISGEIIGYYRNGNEAALKVKDRNGYIGFVPLKKARKVSVCEGGCGRYVYPPQTRCPACLARFESLCESYRAMRAGAKDDADLQQRISEFRGGKLDWRD